MEIRTIRDLCNHLLDLPVDYLYWTIVIVCFMRSISLWISMLLAIWNWLCDWADRNVRERTKQENAAYARAKQQEAIDALNNKIEEVNLNSKLKE